MRPVAALLAALGLAATMGEGAAQERPLKFLRDLVGPPTISNAPAAFAPPGVLRQPAGPLTAPMAFHPPQPALIVPDVPLPRRRPATPAPVSLPPSDGQCLQELKSLGVMAVPVSPINEGRCGIGHPVRVSAFANGSIGLTQKATLECKTAAQVARWLDATVRPASWAHLGGDVTELRVAASYACRSRNSQRGARLSEHGLGRAIDISAFRVERHDWVTVGEEHGARQGFLRAVREASCGPFKTVLGPGSDAHHDDHFHFDLAQRRNGGTYCR